MVRFRERRAVVAMHVVCAVLSSLLAVALVIETAQAGSTYRYCLTTQQVMSGRCCQAPADGSSRHSAAISAWHDCCELRVAPALAPATFQSRSVDLSPSVGIVAAVLPTVAPLRSSAATRAPAVVMRTGPPPARARAQLMVFLI